MNRIVIILFTILFFVMFFYSGINKIQSFDDKVAVLDQKLNYKLPLFLLNIGMICVILLEIIGPIIITSRIIAGKNAPNNLILLSNITFVLFILFLIVVTLIYHPFSTEKAIPFLSNCTTLAGLIFLYFISNSDLIN